MNEKIFEPRLETLLMSKAFKELTADEKAYVLTFLSEEEYHTYAIMLINYKSALMAEQSNIQPSPKVMEALSDAFRERNADSQKVNSFQLTRSQSILGAAAAVLVVIGGLFVFAHTKKPRQPIITTANKTNPVKNSFAGAPQTEIATIQPVRNKLRHPQIAYNTYTSVKHKMQYHKPVFKDAYSNFGIDVSANSIIIDSETLKTIPCLDPRTTMMAMPGKDDERWQGLKAF